MKGQVTILGGIIMGALTIIGSLGASLITASSKVAVLENTQNLQYRELKESITELKISQDRINQLIIQSLTR